MNTQTWNWGHLKNHVFSTGPPNDGGGRGVSGSSDGFEVCSGNGSGDSNGDSAVTEAMMTAIATVAVATVTVAKKQQSTKSCSEKSGEDGGGRGER